MMHKHRLGALAGAIAVAGGLAFAGTGSAAAAARPACTGDSVIISMPLTDASTGVASWNYGYVQLWYNYCTGNNWGRVVSLLGGTTYEYVDVYNNANAFSDNRGTDQPVTSGMIQSPNNPAGSFGAVVANGVNYSATSAQNGA